MRFSPINVLLAHTLVLVPTTEAVYPSVSNFTRMDLPTLPGYDYCCSGNSIDSKAVAVGDFNGDGKLDVVIGNWMLDPAYYYPNVLMINRGDGSGTFLTPTILPGGNKNTHAIAVADVNGDSLDDIIVGVVGRPNMLLLNDGRGNFTVVDLPELPAGTNIDTYSVAVGDVNGDGMPDIVFGNYCVQNQLLLNQGNGSFPSATSLPTKAGCKVTFAVALEDVNGDDRLDIAFGSRSNNFFSNELLLNNGTGYFPTSLMKNITRGPGQNTSSSWTAGIAFGDMNGDGKSDMVVGNRWGSSQLLLNDGSGNFGSAIITLPGCQQTEFVAVGDLDGDGDPDIVLGAGIEGSAPNYLLFNDGVGNFTVFEFPQSKSTSSVALGDVNGDGKQDILFSNANRAYRGNGNDIYINGLTFPPATTRSPSNSPSSRLDSFREKSINSTCSVNSDTFLLECSASANLSISGIFKTNLINGTCLAGNPPTQVSPVSSVALEVNANCKNRGECNQTHCFRADYVVGGVSVLATMSQVVSSIKFEKDGSFSVSVNTSDFTASSEGSNALVAANVTATLGECGSTSSLPEALQIGDTAVVCISSPDNVQLSLKSVTANPGNQVLVNDVGEPNFLTTFNDNARSITLRTLMIPAYFDTQGGNSGLIEIQGTAEITYSARRQVKTRYLSKVEEAFFGLEVRLAVNAEDPEVAHVTAEGGNFGYILGWGSIMPIVIAGAVFVMF